MDDDSTPLTLRYLPLAEVKLWEENPKLHDFPTLQASIRRYGFQDPPKVDMALNGGRGGVVYGNGRIEALRQMHAAGEPPPTGILVEDDGWLVPVYFGLDLPTEAEAEALAVDHNNLTLGGGGFTPFASSELWATRDYGRVLERLDAQGSLPLSVRPDDLPALLSAGRGDPPPADVPAALVRVTLGTIRFDIPRAEFEVWDAALLDEVGNVPDVIYAELRRRLGLEE